MNEQMTIDIPLEVKAALQRKAQGAGKDVRIFVQDMIARQALRPSLDEILAPVRQEFETSGMSEDELDSFMNSVREKAYRDKQDKP
jgi:5'-deoxynucleotidase YfbR-like HD superfamily hydrolase